MTTHSTPPATPSVVPAEGSPGPAARHTPTGRLGQGELRRQVAAHLAATPGSHTPGAIARALGARSAGAVANALETLATRGQAELLTGRPRRFRATDTTSDAAREPTPRPARAPSPVAAKHPRHPPRRPRRPQRVPHPPHRLHRCRVR